jgi:cytochrome c oxidase subunit 2
MTRFWSILFFLVPILGVSAFVMAAFDIPPFQGCWLPGSVTDAGDTIDQLFNGVHYLAAVILLGTGLTLGWILWKFDHRNNTSSKALYIHSNQKLEIIWSLIPGVILVFLAFYQLNSWSENKVVRPTIERGGETIPKPPMLRVVAKQFGWEFYYPGPDGKLETQDDLYIENLMVVPSQQDVVMQLESRDVIHSFFVPELRLKQDVVPGMNQFSWFNARETGELEIYCTELCGWGHYKMKAELRIVSQSDFDQWLSELSSDYQPQYAAETVTELTQADN